MSDSYDVVIIGGGPGGYVAAIRAIQLGLKVACVEKRASMGGTCLNVGCIPSKALLHSSEVFEDASAAMARIGVKAEGVSLDLPTMMSHKERIVDELTKGIAFLFKKNRIEHIAGTATLAGKGAVTVALNEGGARSLEAKNIVIATGSAPVNLPGIEIDENRIVSSTGALELAEVPKHLVVIGGGVIGLELGSVWRRLGAKVTVVEFLERIVPGVDDEVAKTFARSLKKQGMTIRTSTRVTGVKTTKTGATVTMEPAKGGKAESLKCDIVLLCVGRRPYADGLGLETAGVALDEHGRVAVDDHFRTSAAGIYSIGDVIRGPMLAHKAEDEGIAVAEIIAGQAGHVNYDTIPGVIYTAPEVASVGKTEEQLKQAGVAYKAGKFPFAANAKAKAGGLTDGFVKILADAKTDEVLGVHIIGPDAGNMIAEAVLAMEFRASAEDIALTCHAHPTLPEAVKEAALAVAGRAIHM